jgi:hypothetical protein
MAGGDGQFVHRGVNFRISLMHSDFSTAGVRRLASDLRLNIPQVPDGAILITRGRPR